jgi:hypothetical protein
MTNSSVHQKRRTVHGADIAEISERIKSSSRNTVGNAAASDGADLRKNASDRKSVTRASADDSVFEVRNAIKRDSTTTHQPKRSEQPLEVSPRKRESSEIGSPRKPDSARQLAPFDDQPAAAIIRNSRKSEGPANHFEGMVKSLGNERELSDARKHVASLSARMTGRNTLPNNSGDVSDGLEDNDGIQGNTMVAQSTLKVKASINEMYSTSNDKPASTIHEQMIKQRVQSIKQRETAGQLERETSGRRAQVGGRESVASVGSVPTVAATAMASRKSTKRQSFVAPRKTMAIAMAANNQAQSASAAEAGEQRPTVTSVALAALKLAT